MLLGCSWEDMLDLATAGNPPPPPLGADCEAALLPEIL